MTLLVTGPPKKNNDYFVTRYLPSPQKYQLTRYSLLSLTKVLINSLVVTVPSKKVTIKSLVIIFPNIKVLIILYSLLFHIKSNDKFVNLYFSHT
jgi:hypothetical protein